MRKSALPIILLSALALAACSEKTEKAASDTLESAKDDIATQAAPVVSDAAKDVGNAVSNAATDAAQAVGSAASDLDRKARNGSATPTPSPTGTPSPQ